MILFFLLQILIFSYQRVESEFCSQDVKNSLFPQRNEFLPVASGNIGDGSGNCTVGQTEILLKSTKIPKGRHFISVIAPFPWMKETSESGSDKCSVNDYILDVYYREGAIPDLTAGEYTKVKKNINYYRWGGVRIESTKGESFYILITYKTDKNKDCSAVFWATGYYFTPGMYAYTIGIGIGLLILLCCLCCCLLCCTLIIINLPLIIMLLGVGILGAFGALAMTICGCFTYLCCCCTKKTVETSAIPCDDITIGGDGIEGEPLLKKQVNINSYEQHIQGVPILRRQEGEDINVGDDREYISSYQNSQPMKTDFEPNKASVEDFSGGF